MGIVGKMEEETVLERPLVLDYSAGGVEGETESGGEVDDAFGFDGVEEVRRHRGWAIGLSTSLMVAALVVVIGFVSLRVSTFWATSWESLPYQLSMFCDEKMGQKGLDGRRIVGNAWCAERQEIELESPVRSVDGSEVALIVVGDWGRDGYCCQRDVAYEMASAAHALRADAVINTGDNFYELGLTTADDEQIETSWLDVYITPFGMRIPWLGVLGNHDRYGNPDAQIDLTERNHLWSIPAANYQRTFSSGAVVVDMFFFDTNALFYAKDDTLAEMNVTRSFGAGQLEWLQKSLRASTATWKFVIGHHPVHSSGLADEEVVDIEQYAKAIQPILVEDGVDAYFSGHAHNLEHADVDGINFFISGAGSKIWPVLNPSKFSKFAAPTPGFAVVSCSLTTMRVEFVSYSGHILYRTEHQSRS